MSPPIEIRSATPEEVASVNWEAMERRKRGWDRREERKKMLEIVGDIFEAMALNEQGVATIVFGPNSTLEAHEERERVRSFVLREFGTRLSIIQDNSEEGESKLILKISPV